MRSSMPSWRRSRRPGFGLGLVAALVLLGACSPGASNAIFTIGDPWIRPPQGMDRPAAGYMLFVGGKEPDALLSVKTAAAGMVEIHETTTDASGMSGMHPIPRLEIPAGATVELKPGGYHLMLMDVVAGAIEVGKTVELELTFEKAGVVKVQAEVRAG
jgi:periplasmic copper chaperone A